MALNVLTLKFYYEPTPLLPKSDSLLIQYRELTKVFGKGENIMVIGVEDSLFFRQSNFKHWQDLEQSLRRIDGVEHVFSISDILSLGKNTETKSFSFNKIFKEDSYSQAELDSLRNIAFSLPFYDNILFNKDTNVYLMMVTIRYDKISTIARIPFMESLIDTCNNYQQETGNHLRYSGLPYMRTTIGEMIKGEMYMFIFLAVLITAILLFILFRSIRIVLFSLLVVAVSVIWGLGFMSLLGYQITLLTAVIPPLIIVIGVPNCIYLLNKYQHEDSVHGNKVKALQRVIQKIGSATFLTNLTTSAGFGTFVFTNIRILNEFGLVAAIGVMGVFIVSILLIPTIFSFLPPPEPRHLQHLDSIRINNSIKQVINTVLYNRKTVFTITIILVIFGFFGLARVESKGYMVDDVPKNHPVYIDLKYFEKIFAGVMPLEIIIDTEKPKGVLQEGTLRQINQLQNKLKGYSVLSKPISIAEAAKFARQAYYNGNSSQYKLPTGPERAFVMSYLPKNMKDNSLLNRFVDSTGRVTRIIYNVADVGSIRINELKEQIRSEVDSIFKSNSHLVSITGGSIIAAKGNDYLVNSLIVSLMAAIIIISVFIAWMFRRGRMVLLSILPNLVPLLLTAAAMGFIGIALKPTTVIVFSIAFGISVDNSIHFLAKYRQELRRTQNNSKASVVCAIRETGVSMIYTTIVLFFGFGIFAASKFGGTISLGILVSLTLLVALFSNLILLPSILLSLSKSNGPDSECLPS
jgi:predicted RND superfamily exporter protein